MTNEKTQKGEEMKRKLNPQKLSPPPEVSKRMIELDKQKLPNNPIIRFFHIFFGEGF